MHLTQREKDKVIIWILFYLVALIIDFAISPQIIKRVEGFVVIEQLILVPLTIKVIPITIGIFLGLLADTRVLRRKRKRDVDRIAPLIVIELYINKQLIEIDPPSNIKQRDFKTHYWELYKDELSNWAFVNVITLSEIYDLIEHYEESNLVNTIETLKSLIPYLVCKYKNWYRHPDNKKAKKRFIEVLKQYYDIKVSSRHIEILMQIQKDFALPNISEILDYKEEKTED
jgi:hypothetical protein